MVQNDSCPALSVCFEWSDCYDATYFENENVPRGTASCSAAMVGSLVTGLGLLVYAEVLHPRGVRFMALWRMCLPDRCKPRQARKDEVSRTNRCVMMEWVRTEENFCCDWGAQGVSPPSINEGCYTPTTIRRPLHTGFMTFSLSTWKQMLFIEDLFRAFWSALAMSFICNGIGIFAWLVKAHDRFCGEFFPSILTSTDDDDYLSQVGDALNTVFTSYTFLPIFLSFGYVTYSLERWRHWISMTLNIQGSIHRMALLISGAIREKPVQLETRRVLYKLYRYLSVFHHLCYLGIYTKLENVKFEEDYVHLGLINQDEIRGLSTAPPSLYTDVLLSWISTEIQTLVERGKIQAISAPAFLESVEKMRSNKADHFDLFVKDNPSSYLLLMLISTDYLLLLVIIGFPIVLLVYVPGTFGVGSCFQPWTMMGVFIYVSAFRFITVIIRLLRHPFKLSCEVNKVENTIAATDESTFWILRANFRPSQVRNPDLLKSNNNKKERGTTDMDEIDSNKAPLGPATSMDVFY